MHKIIDPNYISINKMVNLSLFISIAIVLSIFESFLPFTYIVPGLKLGLSNIILILILPYYSFLELLLFQVVKVTITSFILGLLSVYLFSLSGALCALIVIYITYKIFRDKVTRESLSVLGAIFHNVGQLFFSIFYLSALGLLYYLPFMVFAASCTGLINGFIISKIGYVFDRNFNDRI